MAFRKGLKYLKRHCALSTSAEKVSQSLYHMTSCICLTLKLVFTIVLLWNNKVAYNNNDLYQYIGTDCNSLSNEIMMALHEVGSLFFAVVGSTSVQHSYDAVLQQSVKSSPVHTWRTIATS